MISRPLDDPAIPDDVPDRARSKGILEVLYGLDAEIEAQGWDQPPIFGFLYQRERRSTEAAEWVTLEFGELPGFGEVALTAPRLYPLIVGLTDQMRVAPLAVPADLVATVLMTESWALVASTLAGVDPDPELTAEYQAASDAHEVHRHPDRVECRILQATDLDGVGYLLVHERDSVVQAVVGPEGTMGMVPAAMAYFMAVATGRDPVEWAEFCESDLYRPEWPG